MMRRPPISTRTYHSVPTRRSSELPRAALDRPVNPVRGCSGAGLAFAVDDELERGELAQAHGAAGVELLGRYADLGAEAELLAVDEAGGGVHDDGGGVDLAGEALCGSQVGGDDRLAVAGAVAGDVGDGGIEGVAHPHGQLQVEELGGVVVGGGGGGAAVAQGQP